MKNTILKTTLLIAVLGIGLWSCNKIEKNNDLENSEIAKPNLSQQNLWKVVGEIEDGNPILSINKAIALETFNAKLLQLSNIDANFTDIIIKELSNGDYSLLFVGDSYISSFYGRANARGGIEVMTVTSCTTSDCSTEILGCIVKYQGDQAYCSPCSNGGVCTKTSSSSAMF